MIRQYMQQLEISIHLLIHFHKLQVVSKLLHSTQQSIYVKYSFNNNGTNASNTLTEHLVTCNTQQYKIHTAC